MATINLVDIGIFFTVQMAFPLSQRRVLRRPKGKHGPALVLKKSGGAFAFGYYNIAHLICYEAHVLLLPYERQVSLCRAQE